MSYNRGERFAIALPAVRAGEAEEITRRFQEEFPGCLLYIELSDSLQFPELKSAESPRNLPDPLGEALAMSAGSFLHYITWREQ
jgi:hypothetical protein